MDQKNEDEIVAKVLKGDRQEYALLVEEYKLPICNLAYRMTGNTEDADDLTQDTFIRAYQNLWLYNRCQKFFTWLYMTALNLIFVVSTAVISGGDNFALVLGTGLSIGAILTGISLNFSVGKYGCASM
jgi:RNA polymerase sigma-70 factor (ECF subfamily)